MALSMSKNLSRSASPLRGCCIISLQHRLHEILDVLGEMTAVMAGVLMAVFGSLSHASPSACTLRRVVVAAAVVLGLFGILVLRAVLAERSGTRQAQILA